MPRSSIAALGARFAFLGLAACAPGLRPLSLPPRAEAASREPITALGDASRVAWIPDLEYLRDRRLMVPVDGVVPTHVPDSFHEKRDAGARIHQAVDILAPRGTPVVAATDGRIMRLRSNTLGGITIYAVDAERRFVYYYAHLDRYREGLVEGQAVVQGQVIGYVGTTGNAPANVPHLHFQVMRMRPDGRWWDGEPVDPRPYLARAGSAGGPDVEATRRASQ